MYIIKYLCIEILIVLQTLCKIKKCIITKNVINFYFLNNILYIKMSELQIIYYIKLNFN